MKKEATITLKVALVFFVMLGICTSARPAIAGGKKLRFHYESRGPTANAFWWIPDSEHHCMARTIAVIASEGLQKGTSGKSRFSGAVAYISDIDFCTWETKWQVQGQVEITDRDGFISDGNLENAVLSATFPTIYDSDGAAHSLEVALELNATEVEWSGKSNFNFTAPGVRFHSRFSGRSRSASADGEVFLDGVNIIPYQTWDASISHQKSGFTEVQ